MNARAHGKKWLTFLRDSPWGKLAAIAVLWKFHDQLPNVLEWPALLALVMLAVLLYAQLLFRDYKEHLVRALRGSLRHPLTFLVALVLGSLYMREAFPFSHFPMYSDPGETSEYYYVAAAGESGSDELSPLPIQNMTKVSSAKVGKIFRSRRNAYCEERDLDRDDLAADDYHAIGSSLLQYLHERARARLQPASAPLPENWVLIHVLLSHDPATGFKEQPEIVAIASFSP